MASRVRRASLSSFIGGSEAAAEAAAAAADRDNAGERNEILLPPPFMPWPGIVRKDEDGCGADKKDAAAGACTAAVVGMDA